MAIVILHAESVRPFRWPRSLIPYVPLVEFDFVPVEQLAGPEPIQLPAWTCRRQSGRNRLPPSNPKQRRTRRPAARAPRTKRLYGRVGYASRDSLTSSVLTQAG